MSNRKNIWHLVVPAMLDLQLEEFIKKEIFKTKSEFIRAAVKEKLETEKAKLQGAEITR